MNPGTAGDATGPIVDSHAHLDDASFDGDRPAVLAAARAAGVVRIVNVGYRPARWETTSALARAYPAVVVALGVHPGHADEWSPRVEVALRRAIAASGAVAVGEAGLDFSRDGPSAETQGRAFIGQIELAIEIDLPLIVHQRAAEAEMVDLLERRRRLPQVVLHSFDGSARLAQFAVERGFALGVGGLATRARSVDLRRLLGSVPLERIMLETDSPYLVPSGIRDRRNQPANLRPATGSLAPIWGVSRRDLEVATTANAQRFFGLSDRPEAVAVGEGT